MTVCLFLFVILAAIVVLFARNNDKVKLVDIDALTFVSGRETTARRGRKLPQLECVRGNCNDDTSLLPVTVQCRNMGTDGIDVQWKCDAELDSRVKFGELEVSCEGYDNPDDPYVLKGSCRLEYELLRVGWPRRARDDDSGISWFWIVIFVCVALCVLRACSRKSNQNEPLILAPQSIQSPQYGQSHGVRSPDDALPTYDQAVYQSNAPAPSALPSMMSHAAAGAAGFALGRATAPTVAPTPYYHQTTTTTYDNTSNSSSSSNKDGSTRNATGFATTKRR